MISSFVWHWNYIKCTHIKWMGIKIDVVVHVQKLYIDITDEVLRNIHFVVNMIPLRESSVSAKNIFNIEILTKSELLANHIDDWT